MSAPAIAGDKGSDDVYGAVPIRAQSSVLRLWFKPWEDADRDLWDQGYLYVVVDAGRWLVDHAQRRIKDAYLPIRPPTNVTAATAAESDKAESRNAVFPPVIGESQFPRGLPRNANQGNGEQIQ